LPFPKRRKVKLEGKAYKKLLLEVFELDGWRCTICQRILPLQGHHLQKRSQGRLDVVENVISVCYRCHDKIERHKIIVIPVDMSKRIIRWKRGAA
jgi:5-methylcytosine-specific restriction endonuclease McrA